MSTEASLIRNITVEGKGLSWIYTPGEPLYRTVDHECEELVIRAESAENASLKICGSNVRSGETVRIKTVLLDNPVEIKAVNGENGQEETVVLHINKEPDPSKLYTEKTRPQYHFTPYAGQMNDPNGLIYNRETDEYHMFFQCNRFFDNGVPGLTGTTSWGHAVSKDLIHWTELPLAITPDYWGMAWSGSAVIDRDNTSGLFDDTTPPESRMVCFYAAVGSGLEYGFAKECMAYSKDGGRTFIRYKNNPVVKNPHDMYGSGLRDPKVFRFEDSRLAGGGIWVMVTVGNLHIFTSHNLTDWILCGRPVDTEGNVFDSECPDLFPLPADGDPDSVKWVYTGGGMYYILGHMDVIAEDKVMFVPETGKIVPLKGFAELWPGYSSPETYATQTIANEKYGRTVSISWLRDPSLFLMDKIWNSAQSVPMEHSLRTVNGQLKLFSYPVQEIKTLRKKLLFSGENLLLDSLSPDPLADIHSICCDIETEITLKDATEITICLRTGCGQELTVRYEKDTGKMIVDKTKTGPGSFSGIYEPVITASADGRISLRILLDRTCFDVYGNNGEAAVAGLIFSDLRGDGMSISANGTAMIGSLKVWEMSRD